LSAIDPVQVRYTEVAYPGAAHPATHIARLAARGAVFGLAPPEVASARVLELGCSQGINLLAMAGRLPNAQFTGVDFSSAEIAQGRALVQASGLRNVELLEEDLRAYAPAPASFDYILVHGVFSWVADDLKEAILRLCAHALSPQGLALISYNTYPGWKQREAIRDLITLRSGGASTPKDRLRAAYDTLGLLERAIDEAKEGHAAHTREVIGRMRAKAEEVLYHDELAAINDPCYFLQFAEWAAEHQLSYVTDSGTPTLGIEAFPPAIRQALEGMNRLEFEQHLDFAVNRTFRSSVLCHADQEIAAHPNPSALRDFSFGSSLAPAKRQVRLDNKQTVHFGPGSPLAFKTAIPLVKALFVALSAAWPQRLSFGEIVSAIAEQFSAAGRPAPEALDYQLLPILLDCCARQRVDFLLSCDLAASTKAEAGGGPAVTPLNRALLRSGQNPVDPWHYPIGVAPADRSFFASLDGSRREFTAAESALLARYAKAGLIE
jgi:SAM-dependent methyltransferase